MVTKSCLWKIRSCVIIRLKNAATQNKAFQLKYYSLVWSYRSWLISGFEEISTTTHDKKYPSMVWAAKKWQSLSYLYQHQRSSCSHSYSFLTWYFFCPHHRPFYDFIPMHHQYWPFESTRCYSLFLKIALWDSLCVFRFRTSCQIGWQTFLIRTLEFCIVDVCWVSEIGIQDPCMVTHIISPSQLGGLAWFTIPVSDDLNATKFKPELAFLAWILTDIYLCALWLEGKQKHKRIETCLCPSVVSAYAPTDCSSIWRMSFAEIFLFSY